jgi:hypothetical protein
MKTELYGTDDDEQGSPDYADDVKGEYLDEAKIEDPDEMNNDGGSAVKRGGGTDSPIFIEDDEDVDNDEPPLRGGKKLESKTPQKIRWVFYGSLASTENVNATVMKKIPDLFEFIYNTRSDGAIIFYAQFKRGSTISKEVFLSTMKQHNIDIKAKTVPDGYSQPPQYQTTKGRICQNLPVEFHWRADAMRRVLQATANRASKRDNSGGYAKGYEPPSHGLRKVAVAAKPPDQSTDYSKMTMGEIVDFLKKQEQTILSQREHIRLITEGGSKGKTGRTTDLEADNQALQNDNDELIAQNAEIKVELRQLRRKNDALLAENKRLKTNKDDV